MSIEIRKYSGTMGRIEANTGHEAPTVPDFSQRSGKLSGVEGTIVWSYYDAAKVAHYTATRVEGGWQLRATVLLADKYKMAQRPLIFVVTHAHGQWKWLIHQFEITEGRLTARLGPLEDAR